MYGNGAWTRKARTGLFVAAPGAALPGAAGLRTVTIGYPTTAATFLAFGLFSQVSRKQDQAGKEWNGDGGQCSPQWAEGRRPQQTALIRSRNGTSGLKGEYGHSSSNSPDILLPGLC